MILFHQQERKTYFQGYVFFWGYCCSFFILSGRGAGYRSNLKSHTLSFIPTLLSSATRRTGQTHLYSGDATILRLQQSKSKKVIPITAFDTPSATVHILAADKRQLYALKAFPVEYRTAYKKKHHVLYCKRRRLRLRLPPFACLTGRLLQRTGCGPRDDVLNHTRYTLQMFRRQLSSRTFATNNILVASVAHPGHPASIFPHPHLNRGP